MPFSRKTLSIVTDLIHRCDCIMVVKIKTIKNESKLKPLNPALKIKSRYVIYEAINQDECRTKKVLGKKIYSKIYSSVKELFGVTGLASMDIKLVKYSDFKGIIRVNRKSVDKLKSSFLFINKDFGIGLISKKVSGTLKKASLNFN